MTILFKFRYHFIVVFLILFLKNINACEQPDANASTNELIELPTDIHKHILEQFALSDALIFYNTSNRIFRKMLTFLLVSKASIGLLKDFQEAYYKRNVSKPKTELMLYILRTRHKAFTFENSIHFVIRNRNGFLGLMVTYDDITIVYSLLSALKIFLECKDNSNPKIIEILGELHSMDLNKHVAPTWNKFLALVMSLNLRLGESLGDIEAMKKALTDGANINHHVDYDESFLMRAVSLCPADKKSKVIDFLISQGADLYETKNNKSAYMIAEGLPDLEIAEQLRQAALKGRSPYEMIWDKVEIFNRDPIDEAKRLSNFIGKKAAFEGLALIAKKQKFDHVLYQAILDQNLDTINARRIELSKMLLEAIRSFPHSSQTFFYELTHREKLAYIKSLLRKGALVNYIEKTEKTPTTEEFSQQNRVQFRTPLVEAACIGNLELIKLLIQAGADPKINIDQKKPLHYFLEYALFDKDALGSLILLIDGLKSDDYSSGWNISGIDRCLEIMFDRLGALDLSLIRYLINKILEDPCESWRINSNHIKRWIRIAQKKNDGQVLFYLEKLLQDMERKEKK